jgi:hypothetical protein
MEVEIDVKPGSDPNSVAPGANGVIAVAVLTSADFDAADVDPASVCFGSANVPESQRACQSSSGQQPKLEDVNNNGHRDLVLHFRSQDTGIAHGDTLAILTGETFDGLEIEGADAIKTVPQHGESHPSGGATDSSTNSETPNLGDAGGGSSGAVDGPGDDDRGTKEAEVQNDENTNAERLEKEADAASSETHSNSSNGDSEDDSDIGASTADSAAVPRGEESDGYDEEDGDG